MPLPLLRWWRAKSAGHGKHSDNESSELPHTIRLYLAQRDIAGAHAVLHHFGRTSQAVPSTCMEFK